MRRPTAPPEMAFFADSRPSAGGHSLGIELGGLSWNLSGLDEALASCLRERYGPYARDAVHSDTSLDVRLSVEPVDYFIDPPEEPELNPVLLALDGDLAGDSYRAIAGAIFGEASIAREPWRTSSLRAATIRLVQAGRQLMDGGYLKLLRGGL